MSRRATTAMLICLLCAAIGLSQDSAPTTAPQMPDPAQMAEMMRKWKATIEPSEHHEILAKMAGVWKTTTTLYMGATVPPIVTQGSSTNEIVLGGRYLQEYHNGQMYMPTDTGQMEPVLYQGIGLFGYDNYKNLYVGMWANTAGTELLTMKGTANPTGNVITYYGEMDEPMLDIHARLVKYVTTIENNDRHTMAIYDLAAGEDHKVVEIVYERVN